MNKRMFLRKDLLVAGIMLLLLLAFFVPRASAQFVPPFGPFYNPFGYTAPFLPPPPPLLPLAPVRYADVPITTSLFPAPTLTAVAAPTTAGVGVTALVPTVSVAAAIPASALITTPLAPLVNFTPLSLVGLTFAPVPVSAAPVPVPLSAITVPATLPTTVTTTLNPTTASVIFSLLSNLII